MTDKPKIKIVRTEVLKYDPYEGDRGYYEDEGAGTIEEMALLDKKSVEADDIAVEDIAFLANPEVTVTVYIIDEEGNERELATDVTNE